MQVSGGCLFDVGLTEVLWLNQGGRITNIVQVVEDAEPLVWQLVDMGEQYSPAEELVFSIQALIEKKMLPPVPDNKK